MVNEPQGGPQRNLAIPPALLLAVEAAVGKQIRPLMEELASIIAESKSVLEQLKTDDGLTNLQLRDELKRCKQKLNYAESKIADLESAVRVWRKNSEMNEANNTKLQDELAEVKYEIGALRSIIENKGGPSA